VFFNVMNSQRKEIERGVRLFRGGHGGENRRFAIGREHGAFGLTRDASGFERQRASAPFDRSLGDVEHLLSSFSYARRRRGSPRRFRTFGGSLDRPIDKRRFDQRSGAHEALIWAAF